MKDNDKEEVNTEDPSKTPNLLWKRAGLKPEIRLPKSRNYSLGRNIGNGKMRNR